MNNEFELLKRFKNGLITFMDELIYKFPSETDFVFIRIFLNDQIPIVHIMDHFIKELLPLKEKVINYDDTFFLHNVFLFKDLPGERVNHFKKMWQSGVLDKDDRKIIFDWFRSFILLAEKYKK